MSMLWPRLQTANQLDRHFPLWAEIGELLEYDPTNGTGQFDLPLRESIAGKSQPTGFIPCGTFFAGAAFGAQFPPTKGMQALVLFSENHAPVAAVFLFNLTDTPPYPDGKTHGWMDEKKNEIKTTDDGQQTGDGAGGARVKGAAYASVVAPYVELGKEGLDATFYVVRHKDLEAMKADIISKMTDVYNTHTHTTVLNTGTPTPPTQQMQNLNTTQASTTVAAND